LIVACIPAYNEEKTIAKVVLLTQKQVDVVVVCDDGSEDLTADIAQRLGATVIRHDENLGYGAAIQRLFRKALEMEADVMVTLDADGQHNPEEIPRLIQPILNGESDVAIGSRFLEEHNDIPAYRRFGIKLITNLVRSKKFSDALCGFRAYGKRAIKSLALYEEGMGVSTEILMAAEHRNLTMMEVPVYVRYKGLDTSGHKQHWLKHGASVIMSIFRLVVEERPLFFLGIPGAVFLCAGVAFGSWMLQIYASRGYIETNVALASIAFVLIGFFAMFTAITLYAISRLAQKQRTEY
jgi:glycosyltransferase involved in cell wall biosynthesis